MTAAPDAAPAAVLVAAGRGDRARAGAFDLPKQFLPLGGRSVLARSFEILRAAGCDPVVVVVAPELLEVARSLLPESALFARGGLTRAASVASGLAFVGAAAVVVHDAVRPLARPALVRRVVEGLAEADGVIPALPVEETLKRVEDLAVDETVARERLWRAQTPQAFRTEVLRAALAAAEEDGVVVTDDAQAVERAGGRVCVVPGDRTNLKITFADDFRVAEALLALEEQG